MTQNNLPIIRKAKEAREKTAIIDITGSYSYKNLLEASYSTAITILSGKPTLNSARIAFLIPSSFTYVRVLWAIWRAGGIAVPLSPLHPQPELEFFIENSQTNYIISTKKFKKLLMPICTKKNLFLHIIDDENIETSNSKSSLPNIGLKTPAIILYTSGTTSKPKGVVLSHQNITNQVKSLVEAWQWTENDFILNILPLHHIHGIINILTCALWSKAKCEMHEQFDEKLIWERFLNGNFTLFMAVPTIYAKLSDAWNKLTTNKKKALSKIWSNFRLMVSGSAALPKQLFEKWNEITGHQLLERYGMTETGMILSNTLKGIKLPGYVGIPLPKVSVMLKNDNGEKCKEYEQGEILVKGENVFKKYWNNEQATKESFQNEWFKTGDIGIIENGIYKILGRNSIDIIKSGGYKISALEIENTLREHPDIKDCAIVGINDNYWGEKIVCAIIPKEKTIPNKIEIKEWLKTQLSSYKTPKEIRFVNDFPRNSMGKISKSSIKILFEHNK